jgi:hypothetical protein
VGTPYTGNPTATQTPSAPPGLGVYPTVVLPADGDPPNGATWAQAYMVLADYLAYVLGELPGRNSPYWGTGADGDVTISSPTPLNREYFFNNLTVAHDLATGGNIINVKNTLTLNGGTIFDNGEQATGPAAEDNETFYGQRWYRWPNKLAGSSPSATGNGNPPPGSMDVAPFTPRFFFGGNGGRGGDATGGSLGANGGSGGTPADFGPFNISLVGQFGASTMLGALTNSAQVNVSEPDGSCSSQMLVGGTGGGSGASKDGTARGGGGGEGGGIVLIRARHVVVTGTYGGKAIQALGGKGGDVTGGGGVGGGGGGGLVLVLCSSWSGEALTSACVAGGAAGTVGIATGATAGGVGKFGVIVLGA